MIDELGTLSESADGWTLHFTRQLEQPPAAVWRALTEPELIEQWFPTTIEGELRTGAPLRFGFKGHDVEPMAGDTLEQNLNPVGRLFYAGSTMICLPTSLAQEVGAALGAQAGEKKLSEVIKSGGFKSVRRATETPFNMILEARP